MRLGTYYMHAIHFRIVSKKGSDTNSGTATQEKCIEQGTWEGVWNFHILSKHNILAIYPQVHKNRTSPNSVFWGFVF